MMRTIRSSVILAACVGIWSCSGDPTADEADVPVGILADPGVVFELPVEERLPAAVRLLGIDISRLSDDVGHA